MSKNLFGAFVVAMVAGSALAGPFSQGNLVVFRAGNGSAVLSSAATTAFLDEYTPAGVLVQSITMPTSVSGSNKRFVTSGNSTSEGELARSADGRYLTLGGYDADVGTASIGTTATTAVLRVMARVGLDGVADTSTTTTAYSGNQIRGVVSNDGGQMWATGGNNGVQYATFGGSSSIQLNQVTPTSTNNRNINIFNGQLYVSSASAALRGVAAVGTGLPTSNGQVLSAFAGMAVNTSSSGYDFTLVSSTLMYMADDSAAAGLGGLQRWELQAGTWVRTQTYTLANGGRIRQFTTTTDALGNNVIYVTSLDSSNVSTIQSLVDTGAGSAFTVVATAGASTLFRGIEFAPIPAPGSVALLGLAGLVAGRRRR
ncbi:MAG: hypothetical protein NTV94_10470 [Planctomycetota bacterium]|nr:hypothetical protein [Planctomycetota bacterium]